MPARSGSIASQTAIDWLAVDDHLDVDPSENQILSVDPETKFVTRSVTVLEEDFSGPTDLETLDTVAESDLWGFAGTAFSNSMSDGTLLFEPVDVSTIDDGTIGFSVGTGGIGPGSFEGAGSPGADFLRVEVSVDGGEFQLLDLFEVAPGDVGLSHELQSFVGSNTGQVFGAEAGNLSYAIPDGAASVQLKLTTELTAVTEIMRIDDVKIGGVQQVESGYETGLLANDGDNAGAGLSIVSVEGVDLFETSETPFTALQEDFDGAGSDLEGLGNGRAG